MVTDGLSIKNLNSTSGVWVPDNEDGTFNNPVIFADYSDPDVIRVGKDFFMVASSFNCMPGIPVLHSNDLVNWKIINHVIQEMPFPEYDIPAHGKGAWAPSLRYHDGYFWVYFAMPDQGIFMSKTADPWGKWSPLVHVKKVTGWIDTCPFWDDDGNAYLVNAFANSRIGFKSILRITRMKPDGTELLNEGHFVFDGQRNHITMEGPKLYKRNGYYYIFTPAGGVKHGWQTVLRAKDIFGPYEDRIVLHEANSTINGPHQGGWVELESGESWFVHFQDVNSYGRIVHLQPVKWEFDWPQMGVDINNDGIGEPVTSFKKPDVGQNYPLSIPQTSDSFNTDKLGLQWQWQANFKREWYSLSDREDYLRLFSVNIPDVEKAGFADAPNVLGQKFPAPSFMATTLLELKASNEDDMAGLAVIGDDYSYLAIKKCNEGYSIAQFLGSFRCDEAGNIDPAKKWEKEVFKEKIQVNKIYLRLYVGENANCSYSYSIDGRDYNTIGTEFTARPGIWIGARTAIFCINKGKTVSDGYADFNYFNVESF